MRRANLVRAIGAGATVALLLAGSASAHAAQTVPTPASARVGTPAVAPDGTVDEGPLGDNTLIHASVLLRPRDPAALERFVTDVSTPGSPQFRHYLRTGEFGPRFGASPAT